MTFFKTNENITIEKKSPHKAVIYNTVTGAKKSLTDKTDIDIISAFITEKEIRIEKLAEDLKIEKSRIITLLKKLAKRNLFVNTTIDYKLFEEEKFD